MEEGLQSFWKMFQFEFQRVPFVKLIVYGMMIAILVHVFFLIYVRLKECEISFRTEVIWILTLEYICLVIFLGIVSRAPESVGAVFDTKHLQWDNSNMDQNMTNLLNVFLYIPLGALLTGILRKCSIGKGMWITLSCSFLLSLFTECVQYLTKRGYFEIDDLEANMLGSLVGSIAAVLCIQVIRKLDKNQKEQDTGFQEETK